MSRKKLKDLGRFPLAAVIALTFGSLVALSGGLVLWLNISANLQSAHSLLALSARQSIESMNQEISSYLGSVARTMEDLNDTIEADNLDIIGQKLLKHVNGVLVGNNHMTLVGILEVDGTFKVWERGNFKQLVMSKRHVSPEVVTRVFDELRDGSQRVFWGEPFIMDDTVIAHVGVPIYLEDKIVAMLTAGASLGDMSNQLAQKREVGNPASFVIDYDGRILAFYGGDSVPVKHISLGQTPHFQDDLLAMTTSNVRQVLMGVGEDTIAAADGVDRYRNHHMFLEHEGRDYSVVFRQLDGFGKKAWVIGRLYRSANELEELKRLSASAFTALGVVILAIILAFFFASRVVRPLKELEERSHAIGSLRLGDFKPMRRSIFREIDEIVQAVNSGAKGVHALNHYVPTKLCSKLIRLGLAGSGVAKNTELTIMFTDITGFTTLAETLDAKELTARINAHLTELVTIIEEEGGTVDKYLGDGILAFWGAPDEMPDHAEAAVRAARRIDARLVELHEQGAKMPTRVRVAVHTGDVVVGNIGAPDRLNYTVLGDAVNVCDRIQRYSSRLQNEARQNTVVISETTYEQIKERDNMISLGPVALKGRNRPVCLWQLVNPD
ncbi:adenylate/guanylate cyclase domain-containing protein [Rhodobacteraceae bacterium RKSG542]|uniref:adenylate/guanylate cyclase domain-containing protein n=1 Tax=Pseudovibrio flavus TaxID=2529854 RepID=UPI0012BD2534|nr:adenylate/guanylate cyclase domain-containing protein [Pseudovibrio flavus]MTI17033.1 adenylate/guanylate cyclase domain-containing protein [Pseudovibrio flavus]